MVNGVCCSVPVVSNLAPYDCEEKWETYNAWLQSGLSTHCYTGEQTSRNYGRYSQKVTKLETANFSHPFFVVAIL